MALCKELQASEMCIYSESLTVMLSAVNSHFVSYVKDNS